MNDISKCPVMGAPAAPGRHTAAGAMTNSDWWPNQLKRFREREKTPYKHHKITADDWRNREKWPQYEQAVCDMIERTSSARAPWCLIPANDKRYARVEVLNGIADAIEKRL